MRLNYTSLNRSPTSLSYLLSSGFKPASLFAQSEPGVWLDPSDVADLAWRRNLLTYSEQFDNAVWLKDGATITTNAAVAPDSTMTADGLVVTTRLYWFDNTGVIGVKIQSIYAKANLDSTLAITAIGGQSVVGGNSVVVNLTTGLSTSGHVSPNVTVTDTGNGWWRISILTYVNTASGNSTYWTIGPTSGIYIWGAQLELGSTATPYQRISDVTTEVLERFPTTTLFQDTTGTTPVTTPGQPVGLVLDKSKGLVLGPELVTNGDFSSGSTGWIATSWVISGGKATISNVSDSLAQNVTLVAGKTYRVEYTLSEFSGTGAFRPRFFGGTTVTGTSRSANGTYAEIMTAVSGNTQMAISVTSATCSGSVDNISVREIPGNHATQATSASRPTYGIEPLGGRRNLLTHTEEFDNAAWTKAGLTVTANQGAAPNGTTAADLAVVNNGAQAAVQLYRDIGVGQGSTTMTMSGYVKSNGATYASVGWVYASGVYCVASFDLSTQTLTRSAAAGGFTIVGTPSITAVSGATGWYRISITATTPSNTDYSRFPSLWPRVNAWTSGLPDTGDTGNGTSGIYIWGAQLELGSTATAYQRVGTAFDVTEAGVASVSYLSFDGVDDSLVTPTITPGIDKVQVFAGVRKLSDTNAACLLELGSSISLNARTFGLFAPGTNGSADYYFGTRGTVLQNLQTSTVYPAPISNVVTAISDISGDMARLHVNGTQAVQNTGDQGTGNFDSYPLYVGRRAGTSLPFNGQIYSLIVRFGTNLTTDQIASIESSVGSKTGFFTPTITGVPTIGVS